MHSSCNNTVVDDLSERTSKTSVDGCGLSEFLALVASTVIHIQKIFRLDCLEGLILTYTAIGTMSSMVNKI